MSERKEMEEYMFDCINDLVMNDNDLIHLKNAISGGRISNSEYVYVENEIAEDSDEDRMASISSSWIRFINMNSRFFDDCSKLIHRESYSSTYYNRLNGIAMHNSSIIDKFINVNIDIPVFGYHLNVLDIIKKLSYKNNYPDISYTSLDDKMKSLNNSIYKILCIGDKNYIAAIITKDGIMYISKNLMLKLFENGKNLNDTSEFIKTVKNILLVFSEISTSIIANNISVLRNDVSGPIFDRIVKNCLNNPDIDYINQDVINIFSNTGKVDVLIDRIRREINQTLDLYLHKTCWGKDFSYSYKRIISDILNCQKDIKKSAAKKAFIDGLKIGSKFEMYGWKISDDPICRRDDSSVVFWEKTVNIRPNKYCFDKHMYALDKKYEEITPFCITKLFLSSSGVMYATGEHPNVFGGKVCMGDIAGKIEVSDVESLPNNLKLVESLLYLINYDSAYSQNGYEWYKEHSHLLNCGGLEITEDFEPEGDNVCSEITYIDDNDIEELNTNE